MSIPKRSNPTNLGNWRMSPHNRWAFQNVRELMPTALIAAYSEVQSASKSGVNNCDVLDDGLIAQLEQLETDSLVVLKDGQKQFQWAAGHCDIATPHIVFSISKSITALVAGCLWQRGILDTQKPVSYYLEQTKGSGYEDCTVQQLLDMQVSLSFTEDYTDPNGDYFHYRNATGWNPVDQTKGSPSMEEFLYGLQKGDIPHGDTFAYKSPNSDLLGLLLERVAEKPFAELLSELIWIPMGAQSDGYVTVDSAFLARGAGGICVTVNDLATLGQLFLDGGAVGTRSVIPESWIQDTCHGGNKQAWLKGEYANFLPDGNYRNKWYQVGDADQIMLCLGIHGQWLFIDPSNKVVIAKLSSQQNPFDEALDIKVLKLLKSISRKL